MKTRSGLHWAANTSAHTNTHTEHTHPHTQSNLSGETKQHHCRFAEKITAYDRGLGCVTHIHKHTHAHTHTAVTCCFWKQIAIKVLSIGVNNASVFCCCHWLVEICRVHILYFWIQYSVIYRFWKIASVSFQFEHILSALRSVTAQHLV